MATQEEDLPNGDFADDADVESESSSSSLFDLDLTVFGDQWVASGGREDEVDSAGGDGGEAVNVELKVASAEEDGRGVGDGGVVAALGPAARLLGLLLRKLRKSKAAGNPAGGGGAVSPEGQSGRFLAKVRADSVPRSEARAVAGGEERRAATNPKEAARKYMKKITTSLARRRGGPDPAMVAAPTTAKTTRRRSFIMGAAAPPTPTPRRGRDGSAQHLQDGIESAIAHCNLSLRAATTEPS